MVAGGTPRETAAQSAPAAETVCGRPSRVCAVCVKNKVTFVRRTAQKFITILLAVEALHSRPALSPTDGAL